jgi:transcriptional regulator with XRE-family HTH domain
MEGAEKLAIEDAVWSALGNHVRQVRRALDLTQDQLAKRSGISEPSVRKIENHTNGKSHRDETLERLSHGLGEEKDYLHLYWQTLLLSGVTPEPPPVAAAPSPLPEPKSQSVLEILVPRIKELMKECLNEMVVRRLDNMEEKVQGIWDAVYNTGTPADLDMKPQHPAAPE